MSTVKETVKAGAKLGLFQKLYKQLLKFKSPKEAKEAAEAAIKKSQEAAKQAQEAAKKALIEGKKTAKKVKETKTTKINEKKVKEFGEKVKKIKKTTAIVGGTALGTDFGIYGVTGQSPALGPIVKKITGFKRGGAVKKRAKSSSKKSRGTGAAIRGTKFKGVF